MFCKISYINHIGLSLLAMLLVMIVPAGCSDDLDNGLASGDEAGYITLNLRNVKGSRATDDANNEDRLERAVVCLYPNGAVAATTPSYVEYFDLTANETATVKIKLSKTLASALFGDGNGTCTAYVVANLPADAPAITTSTPLADISKFTIYSDFASMQPQTSFVMDGTGNVNRSGYGTAEDKATGTIELRRAASRISLAVEVADRYTDAQDNVWTPEPSNMSVLITNGVNRSQVESSTYTPVDGDYYSTTTAAENLDHRQRGFSGPVSGEKYNYQLASPFYTFPNKWSENETETPMTYMTLMLPWRNETTGTVRTCFYMVPVVKGNELIRNVAYSVKLSVNVLGSFTPDKPLPLTDLSYYAVDWGSLDVDVNLNESRYLVVDRNNYTMDNEENISIPVYTSHETVITDIKMKYRRYYTDEAGNEFTIEIPKDLIEASNKPYIDAKEDTRLCEYEFKNISEIVKEASVEFTHKLNIWEAYTSTTSTTPLSQTQLPNNLNRIQIYKPSNPLEKAYSRYTIEITIQHKDIYEAGGTSFKEVLTIEQYPQMYIESDQNWTGGSITVGSGWNQTTIQTTGSRYGNVYINNNHNTNAYWGNPSDLSGNNSNPNMYIITTTQLDNNTRYIIGDPRKESVDNPNYTFEEVNDLYGTKRALTNYYPADPSKDKYIAPKFRVASSWGKSYSMSKDEAIRRCASFQERDCPAGRWRLPTRSELEYIMTMSDKKYIPLLFNLNSSDVDDDEQNGYWTAQGRVVQLPSATGGILKISQYQNEASVRCVYDEWYWTDKVPQNGTIKYETGGWNSREYDTNIPYYPFTWGDKSRTN